MRAMKFYNTRIQWLTWATDSAVTLDIECSPIILLCSRISPVIHNNVSRDWMVERQKNIQHFENSESSTLHRVVRYSRRNPPLFPAAPALCDDSKLNNIRLEAATKRHVHKCSIAVQQAIAPSSLS